jgi:dTDP-4-dehydrorhamnose reductase
MKTLIIGKNGQLAWELQQSIPPNVEVIVVSRQELDVTNAQQVLAIIEEIKPNVVINASAYTAVDKAETDSLMAYEVNVLGPKNLANACKKVSARLIHISTDFVFDGNNTVPYTPEDITNPLGIYGKTKLEGEEWVQRILGTQATIIRTAWVYSVQGNNFVKTMLKLLNSKAEFNVVADQKGTPTWAASLANACWAVMQDSQIQGVHHFTDAGETTWYDFAVEIQKQAQAKGLLSTNSVIKPIPATEYPTPATRPYYSVLNTSTLNKIVPPTPWQQQLSKVLEQLPKEI